MTAEVVLGTTFSVVNVGSQVANGFSKVIPVVGVAAVALGGPALMFMGVKSLTSRVMIGYNFSEPTAKISGIALGVLAGAATFCVIWSALFFTSVLEVLKRNY